MNNYKQRALSALTIAAIASAIPLAQAQRAGDTANLRRVSSAFCDEANAAVAAIADESAEEADECYQAKRAVVNAASVEGAELAATKMRLLCND